MIDKRILIADDDPLIVKRVESILKQNNFSNLKTLTKISSLSELIGFDIVLMDIVWPKEKRPATESSMNLGFTALKHIKAQSPKCGVILMSKHLFDMEELHKIVRADAYIKSTADGSSFLDCIQKVSALEQKETSSHAVFTQNETDNILHILKMLMEEKDNPEIEKPEYRQLKEIVTRLKEDESEVNKKTIKEKLTTAVSISTLTKNIVDLFKYLY